MRWSTATLIVRGVLYALTGAGIAWWAWPSPNSSVAMLLFVCFGTALSLGGVVMAAYGLVRAPTGPPDR